MGLLALAVVVTTAFAAWYSTTGDTTTILAALVDPTTVPAQQPTANPTAQAERQARNRQAQAELANGAFGTIQAVNGLDLTLQDANGETSRYTLSRKTRLIVVGKPDATAGDLRMGDKVLVLGAKDETSVTPRVVVSVPAAFTQSNLLMGRVTRAADNAMQLQTAKGVQTVTLASGTEVYGARFLATSPADLKPNATVLLFGEPQAGGFTAQVVLTLPKLRAGAGLSKPERKQAKRDLKAERKETKQQEKAARKQNPGGTPAQERTLPGAFGTVQSVRANEIQVLTEQRGAKTFLLDMTTQIIAVGAANATTGDIQPGDKVLILGGGKKRAARTVLAAPAAYTEANLAVGKIKAVNADGVTLKNQKNEVRVTTRANTQLLNGTAQPVALKELELKQKALAIGTRDGASALDAQVLFVIPKRAK